MANKLKLTACLIAGSILTACNGGDSVPTQYAIPTPLYNTYVERWNVADQVTADIHRPIYGENININFTAITNTDNDYCESIHGFTIYDEYCHTEGTK